MRPHHQAVIDRLVEHFAGDPVFPALIVGGSIAHGWERDDSDVDIVLVATDEEYARREPTNDLHYFTRDLCDYPGGYVDGKIVNMAFLREVAERGSDPARAAFFGAQLAYSRLPEVAQVLDQISTYPEDQRQERLYSFMAQFEAVYWYVGEAAKRRQGYLMMHMCSDLILYGGRLLLAHNRVFFPYYKWFIQVLEETPNRPADLIEKIDAVVAQPCAETAEAFYQCVKNFTAWEQPPEGWPARFMRDTEWSWRCGCAGIEDW
jgi:hypothetical protein